MNRADEIRRQMAELRAELEDLPPHATMSVRELARASGVSPATASRFKNGEVSDMQMSTVSKLMPFTNVCPCCAQTSDPEAWGEASTEPNDGTAAAPLISVDGAAASC